MVIRLDYLILSSEKIYKAKAFVPQTDAFFYWDNNYGH
jgi:hypothetical protein